jgi:hypothetical protein
MLSPEYPREQQQEQQASQHPSPRYRDHMLQRAGIVVRQLVWLERMQGPLAPSIAAQVCPCYRWREGTCVGAVLLAASTSLQPGVAPCTQPPHQLPPPSCAGGGAAAAAAGPSAGRPGPGAQPICGGQGEGNLQRATPQGAALPAGRRAGAGAPGADRAAAAWMLARPRPGLHPPRLLPPAPHQADRGSCRL